MLFSIVVPTVNRPETLIECLKTLTSEKGDDFEIIISDDCGDPENAKVFEQFKDDLKVKYFRQSHRLGMRGNYEKALEYCSGDYITILGDDDGLVSGGLEVAREVLTLKQPDIIFWWPHMYWWPNALISKKQNLLYILKPKRKVHWVESKDFVKKFFQSKNQWQFERLPSIYNGFVSRNFINKVKNQFGEYFHDEIPDVGSGILNGIFCESSALVDWPITIRGISGKSFGVAFRHPEGKELAKEFKAQMKTKMCEDELLDSSSLAVHIASTKLRAIKKFPIMLGDSKVEIQDVIDGIISEVSENQGQHLELIEDANNLAKKYDLPLPDTNIDRVDQNKKTWGWGDDLLCINCEDIEVKNINDAAKLITAVVGKF